MKLGLDWRAILRMLNSWATSSTYLITFVVSCSINQKLLFCLNDAYHLPTLSKTDYASENSYPDAYFWFGSPAILVQLVWHGLSAGKLIGLGGTYIKKLKEECRCNIVLKVWIIHYSVSFKCPEISFMFCSQETDGLKPKKGAKGKRGRNSRQQASAPQGEIKVCSIEGTRASIDKCLDIVKQKWVDIFLHTTSIPDTVPCC